MVPAPSDGQGTGDRDLERIPSVDAPAEDSSKGVLGQEEDAGCKTGWSSGPSSLARIGVGEEPNSGGSSTRSPLGNKTPCRGGLRGSTL